MHLQNKKERPAFDAFLDKKWVRILSYSFASLLIFAGLAVCVDRKEFPEFTMLIIMGAATAYMVSDFLIRKKKRQMK